MYEERERERVCVRASDGETDLPLVVAGISIISTRM